MDALTYKAKVADVQYVAEKLAELPRDALMYIAGYAEGRRDAQQANAQKPAS